jgi:hypothetical protein
MVHLLFATIYFDLGRDSRTLSWRMEYELESEVVLKRTTTTEYQEH